MSTVEEQTIQPSHPLVIPFSCLQSFPMSGLFTIRGQIIGSSALASALPMNIQSWFPLGLTDLISLQSRGLSRVFSNTTVPKHQFFSAQLFYCLALTFIQDCWNKAFNLYITGFHINLCIEVFYSPRISLNYIKIFVIIWFFLFKDTNYIFFGSALGVFFINQFSQFL